MEIFINTLSPSKEWMTSSLTVQPTDTVGMLMAKLSDQFGSGNHCRFNGEPLPPESTLEECFVVEHSTVYYVKPADTVFASEQKDSTSTTPNGSVRGESSDIKIYKTGKLLEAATVSSTESVSSEPAVAATTVSDEEAKKTVESSLWDQLVQSKKLADQQEKDLVKTLAKAKCSKGFPIVQYLTSGKDVKEFLSNHTRFFVVVVSKLQSIDSITKICSAVSAAVCLPIVVTTDIDIAKVLAGDVDIEGHFYKCGSKLWVFDSFVLVEKKLLKFLKDCMLRKSCKWLK